MGGFHLILMCVVVSLNIARTINEKAAPNLPMRMRKLKINSSAAENELKKVAEYEGKLFLRQSKPSFHKIAERYEVDHGLLGEFRFIRAAFPYSGSLWPTPKKQIESNHVMKLDTSQLHFHLQPTANDILKKAASRYRRLIVEQHATSVAFDFETAAAYEYASYGHNVVANVFITTSRTNNKYPSLEMNEEYQLDVQKSGDVKIFAAETWGVLRALETLTQLIVKAPNGAMFLKVTTISDAPRFAYRGLMVDTARHFIEKQTLLRVLDGMVMNKLNVFHWHIVDDSSFPFESQAWPLLSKYGSYDPMNKVYTHNDVVDIVEYARLRGIRVVPEFDTPAHTYSWGLAYPQLLTPCSELSNQTSSSKSDDIQNNNFGPLDVSKDFTYHFLRKLFEEVLALFPDEFLHIGVDNVNSLCWKRSINHDQPYSHSQLLENYLHRLSTILTDIANKHKRIVKFQMWNDDWFAAKSTLNNTIVQLKKLDLMLMQGKGLPKFIFSACWQLNAAMEGAGWTQFYKCYSKMESTVKYNKKQMLGGEVCVWTEKLDDKNLAFSIWPNTAAAAERLWSEVGVDFAEVGPKIEEHRCRMIARGIQVGVVGGPGSCSSYSDKHSDAYLNSLNDLIAKVKINLAKENKDYFKSKFILFIYFVGVLIFAKLVVTRLYVNLTSFSRLCIEIRDFWCASPLRLYLFVLCANVLGGLILIILLQFYLLLKH